MLRVLLPIFPWQSVDNVSQPRCSRMRPDDVDFVGAVETKPALVAEGSLRTYRTYYGGSPGERAGYMQPCT